MTGHRHKSLTRQPIGRPRPSEAWTGCPARRLLNASVYASSALELSDRTPPADKANAPPLSCWIVTPGMQDRVSAEIAGIGFWMKGPKRCWCYAAATPISNRRSLIVPTGSGNGKVRGESWQRHLCLLPFHASHHSSPAMTNSAVPQSGARAPTHWERRLAGAWGSTWFWTAKATPLHHAVTESRKKSDV